MEVTWTVIRVTESSQTAQARRAAFNAARALGFNDERAGVAALVATEMATNLVKHAQQGELLIRAAAASAGRPAAVTLLAIDRGPGIESIPNALRDGYSTSGSPGTGLGAIQRTANVFDIYSQPGRGTVLLACVDETAERGRGAGKRALPLIAGVLSVAYPGESVCGDGWVIDIAPLRAKLMVVDGLGHGMYAAEAAQAAMVSFRSAAGRVPPEILEIMHTALRSTRGAAAAVADIDLGGRRVTYAGVGNIAGTILGDGAPRHLVSHAGTLGFEARHFTGFTHDWPKNSVLIMHSDGLGSRWSLNEYPGLLARHPLIIAGVLYRDFARGSDDVTVLVCKEVG